MDIKLVVRLILTTVLLIGAYKETGPFTVLILALISISIEVFAVCLKQIQKEVKMISPKGEQGNQQKEICAICGGAAGNHQGYTFYSRLYHVGIHRDNCPKSDSRVTYEEGPGTTYSNLVG